MRVDMNNTPDEGRVEFPKLELKKNEVARICILGTKGIEVTVRHWVTRLGYLHCHALEKVKDFGELLKIEEDGGRPEDCYMCNLAAQGDDRVSSPYRRFAIRVLRYKTNMEGTVSHGGLKYWLEIWIADNYKYRQLKRIQKEWEKLSMHDLTLTCTDEKYQNYTIDVKKDALWVQEKAEVRAYAQEEAKKYKLMECLGLHLDAEKLKRRLAIAERRTATDEPVDLEEGVLDEPSEEKATAEAESKDDTFDLEEKTEGEVPAVTEKKEEEDADFLEGIIDED